MPANAFIVSNPAPIVVQEGWPVWLHAADVDTGGTRNYLKLVRWDWGDYNTSAGINGTGRYNFTTGFNSAHVYDRAGNYMVRAIVMDLVTGRVGVKCWTVVVEPNVQPVLYAKDYVELKALIATKPGSIIKATGTITSPAGSGDALLIRGTATVPTIVDGQGNLFLWSRQLSGGVIFSTTNGGVRNFKVDTVTPPDAPFVSAPTVVNAWDKTWVLNLELIHGLGQCVSKQGNAQYLLVQDSRTTREDSIKGGFIWSVGSDNVVLGNTVVNSAAEHCLRSGGTVRLALNYNNFQNLDTRSLARRLANGQTDPNDWHTYDIAKQSCTVHLTDLVCVAHNKFRGGRVELGPLGGGDGVTKPDWQNVYLRDVQFFDNDCDFTLYNDNHLEVDNGVDGFLIKDNRVNCKTSTPLVLESIDHTSYPVKVGKNPDGTDVIEMRNYGTRNVCNGMVEGNDLRRLDGKTLLISVPADATNIDVRQPKVSA